MSIHIINTNLVSSPYPLCFNIKPETLNPNIDKKCEDLSSQTPCVTPTPT